jgi:hypothetical protein
VVGRDAERAARRYDAQLTGEEAEMIGPIGHPDRAQLAAQIAAAAARRQQEAARKKEEQREKYDLALRVNHIRQGIERPADEFLGLGVIARDGKVRLWSTTVVRKLGPLAGAQAGIAGPLKTSGAVSAAALTVTFGATGAVAALARRGTKPFAYVVFPDGTLYQTPLGDKKLAARAQADVLRFNALAETARKGGEHI